MKYKNLENQTIVKNIEIYERIKDYVHPVNSMLDKQDRINDLIVAQEEH